MQARLAALLLGLAAVDAFVQPGGILVGKGRATSAAARGAALGLRAPREGVNGGPLGTRMSGEDMAPEGSRRARFLEKLRRVKAFTVDVGITPVTAKLSKSWAKWYLTHEGTPEEREQWRGKTAIVTGASGGIGQQVALGLAARGFKVILAVRNVDKGQKARKAIQEAYPNAEISIKQLDLASLKSVRSFAEQFSSKDLSVLVLNAGYGGGGEGGLTEDGLEWYFQVNHLGHFLLTHLLWPNLVAAKGDSRVISVSSVMHWRAEKAMPKDLKDLDDWIKVPTGAGGEYRRSKLFNVMFSNLLSQLQPHASAGRKTVKAHAVNPGFVYSDIWRHETSDLKRKAYSAYCKTTEQGAVGIVRAATEERYGQETGLYLVDGKPAKSSELSHDKKVGQWLWKTSERLAGIPEGGFGGFLSGGFLKTQPTAAPAPSAPAPVSVQPAYTIAQTDRPESPAAPPAAAQPVDVQQIVSVQPVGFEVVGGQAVVAAPSFKLAEDQASVQPVVQAASAPPKPAEAPWAPRASPPPSESEVECLKNMHDVTENASSKIDDIAKAASDRLQKMQAAQAS